VRTTGWLVASALALCGGVWLIVTAFAPARPTVAEAVGHLRRPHVALAPARPGGPVERIGAGIGRGVGSRTDAWVRPLRLIGRAPETHLGLLALAALAGLVLPSIVLGALQVLGVVSLAPWVPAMCSLATALALPLAVHADAMARSAAVAVDVRHQLGAYLDMVTMLLAGNTGHEGALEQAAQAGDGLLFRQLRRRMREVATSGHSYVRALELVADDLDVAELRQVADTATLSANEGAPVARTLAAKCATLRSTLAADQEAAARIRTDKVTPPLVGMALLFMVLVIYPALDLG
jgi:hypothetical protein